MPDAIRLFDDAPLDLDLNLLPDDHGSEIARSCIREGLLDIAQQHDRVRPRPDDRHRRQHHQPTRLQRHGQVVWALVIAYPLVSVAEEGHRGVRASGLRQEHVQPRRARRECGREDFGVDGDDSVDPAVRQARFLPSPVFVLRESWVEVEDRASTIVGLRVKCGAHVRLPVACERTILLPEDVIEHRLGRRCAEELQWIVRRCSVVHDDFVERFADTCGSDEVASGHLLEDERRHLGDVESLGHDVRHCGGGSGLVVCRGLGNCVGDSIDVTPSVGAVLLSWSTIPTLLCSQSTNVWSHAIEFAGQRRCCFCGWCLEVGKHLTREHAQEQSAR